MRIASLKLKNFQCYKGDHTLELEAKAYAITARLEGDAGRSNWLGKSSLLQAIRFVLFGVHIHRLDDEWITDGESSGEVEATFDNGIRVVRSRARGKSTRLWFFGPYTDGSRVEAVQGEAQKQIETALGLDDVDFMATCYFEQKKMSGFISATPDDRLKIITSWLHLEPLRQCEKDVRADLAAMSDTMLRISHDIMSRDVAIKAILGTHKDVSELDSLLAKCTSDHAAALEVMNKLKTDWRENEALVNEQSYAAAYKDICEQGIALAAELKIEDGEAIKKTEVEAWAKHSEALQSHAVISSELKDKSRAASGKFDGMCPVAGITCPATQVIRDTFANNASILQDVNKRHDFALKERVETGAVVEDARMNLRAHDLKKSKLDSLREQAKKLKTYADAWATNQNKFKDREQLSHDVDQASDRVQYLANERGTLRRSIESFNETLKTKESLQASFDERRGQLATLREALIIFGKNGAQRRVAEGALGQIEGGANEVLTESGINLSLRVLWSREGQGLAPSCDQCGNPFPSSVKFKVCPRCQSERGANTVNRLDIELSNRSGGSEDLAGVAFQLSASAWLRTERASAWGVGLIDEPFGALDDSHRKSLAAHLAAMLSGSYGFIQSFVIAHHQSVLDTLPGRIEVVSDGKHSAVRVVA